MVDDKEREQAEDGWFKDYIRRIENGYGKNQKKFGDYYTCPCCGYPTLTEPDGYDICHLCSWQDDGQDDPYADEIWYGPNKDYSLTQARENFIKYYTKYRPIDAFTFEDSAKVVELKKKMIEKYKRLLGGENESKILWDEINSLEKLLRDLRRA